MRWPGPPPILARTAFCAWAALLWACATGASPYEFSDGDEGGAATSGLGGGATAAQSSAAGTGGAGASGGAGAGGGSGGGPASSAAASSGSGGAASSSSSASSSASGSGGSGGGEPTSCTVFETSVNCLAGWTEVYVGTTGSQGGNFTYMDGACLVITDVNCNATSSVGTSCPIVNTTMTVIHTPCDNSPPCTISFPVICP